MAPTTLRRSAMAALLVMLIPAVAVSSNTIQDEKNVLENGITGLRQRKLPRDRVPDMREPPNPIPTPSPVPATRSPVPRAPEIRDPIRPTTRAPTNHPTTGAPTSPPLPPPKVITLGDSYSSGTGIHRDGDDYDVEYGGAPILNGVTYDFTENQQNACWMEKHTTPGPRYAADHNWESVFYGCGGAQVPNMHSQLDYLNAAYPADRAANFQGSTILFTAGGNDIRTVDGSTWPELLEHCILNLWPCHTKDEKQIANWNSIRSSLEAFYRRLAVEASGATIRVMGYPKMMQRDPGCGSVTGISRNEADWIDAQCDLLNVQLIYAVNAVRADYPNVDIEYVEVRTRMTVGACGNGPSNRHVNDKILHGYFPYRTSNSSFHPSQKGYNEYYNAFVASI